MDNASRSERTRSTAIQAALTIIVRDGPARLTLDAIAREGGISKGALTHHFPTKRAVLKALLEHQVARFSEFSRTYRAEHEPGLSQPRLATEIATMREAIARPDSVAFAILGAAAEDPSLLDDTRKADTRTVATIADEATDPDLAALRWMAARGLVLSALLGICPFAEKKRAQLFDRLLDERSWAAPRKARRR
jgi:AcrR family transcriptional regulator